MTPTEMVEKYIRIRDHKKAAEAEFKKSMERINQATEKLENMLLEHMNKNGNIKSIACEAGTVYRNKRVTATVEDAESFMAFVDAEGNTAPLDIKANKTYVEEYVAQHGAAPPGIKYTVMDHVGVRRS